MPDMFAVKESFFFFLITRYKITLLEYIIFFYFTAHLCGLMCNNFQGVMIRTGWTRHRDIRIKMADEMNPGNVVFTF